MQRERFQYRYQAVSSASIFRREQFGYFDTSGKSFTEAEKDAFLITKISLNFGGYEKIKAGLSHAESCIL